MMFARATAAAAALALSSCAAVPAAPPPAGSCPIASSSDWAAWVNAMPGPNARPTLIVTGTVTAPADWDFVWRDARVMESYPVQIAISLEPLIPQTGRTAPLAARQLRHEMAVSPPVGSVTVHCGGRVLARISPVETAH